MSLKGVALIRPEDYESAVQSLKVGDGLKMAIYREKKRQKVELVLPERLILPGDLPGGYSSITTPQGDRPLPPDPNISRP